MLHEELGQFRTRLRAPLLLLLGPNLPALRRIVLLGPSLCSKNLHAILCDEQRLFRRSAPSSIHSSDSPVVRPADISPIITEIQHRLNRKDMAGLHDAVRLLCPVVEDGRRAMEEAPDAVPCIPLHYCAAARFGERLDDVPDRAVGDPWAAERDSCIQTTSRSFDEFHCVFVRFRFRSDGIGCISETKERTMSGRSMKQHAREHSQVSVEAFVIQRDIEVDRVAVFQYRLVGNAMTDDFIDGAVDAKPFQSFATQTRKTRHYSRANALGKAMVI